MKKIDDINGILQTPLKIIPGEKGDVLHVMKKCDPGFSGFEEAYFSFVRKGETKGWKKHLEMTLNLVVPVGRIQFYAYDDRVNSDSNGFLGTVEISKENYYRLTVPPGVWLAFSGKEEYNLLLNLANLVHNPKEAINIPINEFGVSLII